MFSRIDGDKLSLNDMCNELDDKFECSIAKQSIHDRFNQNAVDFLKLVVAQSISEKIDIKNSVSFLSHFNTIRIQDSTSFQIPKSFSEYYGGCGGAASGALARIQYEYDLKKMTITTLDLTSGSYQDVSYSKDKVEFVNKGDLLIRDLGYISGAFLREVIQKEAYFLNRLRSKQTVFVKNSNGDLSVLDFSVLQKRMKRNKLLSTEQEILLEVEGKHIEMRLIVEKMPDNIYAERIRKAEKEAKKKGRKLSNEYKLRAWFNLFVTNVEKGILKTREVGYLYSLRWQIELIFKSWKSTFNIAKVKPMKKERFECQIYARLLLIIISWKMFSIINNAVVVLNGLNNYIISYFKFNKTIYMRLESLMFAVILKGMWLQNCLMSLIKTAIGKNQYIEPKSKTISSIHIFEFINNMIDNEDDIHTEAA